MSIQEPDIFYEVFELTSAAQFIIKEKQFLHANPAFEALTGYTSEDLRAIGPLALFSRVPGGTETVCGLPPLSQIETTILAKDGVEKWIVLTTAPMAHAHGRVLLGTARDLTQYERKEAEANHETIQGLQRQLEAGNQRLELTRGVLKREKNKLDELRRELQKVNESLLSLTAHMARMRDDLEMEVAAALKMRVMPILRQLQSDPAFAKFRLEFEMLTMHLSHMSDNLEKSTPASKFLSVTELRIAALIKSGMTSGQIAAQLCLSLDTVKTHRRNIRKKLGIQNTTANLSSHLKDL